jgi:hypothetical protein
MFDELRSASKEAATDVAYRVGLRVWERDRFRDWRKWLNARPDGRLSPEAVQVATHMLEQIEAGTGKPLAELSDAEVRPYLHAMYEVMEQRWKAEATLDPAVARRILEEMRRDYGSHYRAVA